MVWIQPDLSWAGSDVPAPSDFARIEGNTQYLKDAIEDEAVDRGVAMAEEATARTAAILVETNARIAADALKMPMPTTTSDGDEDNYPIGTIVVVMSENHRARNTQVYPNCSSDNNYLFVDWWVPGAVSLDGTWRARGSFLMNDMGYYCYLAQRVA